MKRIALIIILTVLFSIVHHAYGQTATVKINEVLIEPTPQIVELLNTGSEIVNISNWFIDDNGGTTYFTIPEGTLLYPNACMSFDGSFNLNRTSADSVRLFNSTAPPTSPSAQLADLFEYKASSGSGVTFQRVPDGADVWATGSATLNQYNLNGQSCVYLPTSTPTPQPTPTAISLPTPTVSPTSQPTTTPVLTPSPTPSPAPEVQAIYLSEVYPYPTTGEHEWVELYNDNEFPVTLEDWKLDDIANGGSAPKKFTLTIPGYSFGVVDQTSSMFNNDADSVRLLTPTDREIESFSYDGVEKSNSIARQSFTGTVFCLQRPTRGYSNSGCVDVDATPTPTPTPTTVQPVLSAPTPRNEFSRSHEQLLGRLDVQGSPTDALYITPPAGNNLGEDKESKQLNRSTASVAEKKTLFTYTSILTLISSFLTAGWIFIRIIL